MSLRLTGLIVAAATLIPIQASACTGPAPARRTPAEALSDARAAIADAAAIVDGEVIRPLGPDGSPALIRVLRVYKGPRRETIQVGMRTSCDMAILNMGRRMRLVLMGGPDIYTMPMMRNFARLNDALGSPSDLPIGP